MADLPDLASGRAPHYDVAGYVLGTLTEVEIRAFEEHLAGCDACRAEVAELGSLPSLLRTAAAAPPDSVRQRTFDAIAGAASQPSQSPSTGQRWAPPRQQAQPGPAGSGGPAGPADLATPPFGTDLPAWRTPGPGRPEQPGQPGHPGQPEHQLGHRPGQLERPGQPGQPSQSGLPGQSGLPSNVTPLRARRARTVRWLAAAAAAIVVVAAVGVGAVLLNRDGGTATTIALAAADVGSGRGEAVVRDVDGGRKVELAVSGLPANPPGTYYECWFVGPGDTEEQPNRVSAGTFTVDAAGNATVTMISAADPARFPKMGVTLEPDDGNPARTGPKYLVSP